MQTSSTLFIENLANESRSEILDELILYIFERAKCEEDTDKYLEHVLNYCEKDYPKACKNKN